MIGQDDSLLVYRGLTGPIYVTRSVARKCSKAWLDKQIRGIVRDRLNVGHPRG